MSFFGDMLLDCIFVHIKAMNCVGQMRGIVIETVLQQTVRI